MHDLNVLTIVVKDLLGIISIHPYLLNDQS